MIIDQLVKTELVEIVHDAPNRCHNATFTVTTETDPAVAMTILRRVVKGKKKGWDVKEEYHAGGVRYRQDLQMATFKQLAGIAIRATYGVKVAEEGIEKSIEDTVAGLVGAK